MYLPRHGTERDAERDTGTAAESEPQPAVRELLSEKDARIEDLRAQLAAEREANRENRRIIAGLTQRIPELEAAERPEEHQDAPHGPENPAEDDSPGQDTGGAERPSERRQEQRRPWWRRMFSR